MLLPSVLKQDDSLQSMRSYKLAQPKSFAEKNYENTRNSLEDSDPKNSVSTPSIGLFLSTANNSSEIVQNDSKEVTSSTPQEAAASEPTKALIDHIKTEQDNSANLYGSSETKTEKMNETKKKAQPNTIKARFAARKNEIEAQDASRSGSKMVRSSSHTANGPPTVWENPNYFIVYKNDGKKYFQCRGYGSCNMQFTRAEHLARHIRKHTGEKPYRCGCRQYFSRLDNLRQHCASAHPTTELKYEITNSGYRNGIELAPCQKFPCPDEEEYLESIGIDPEFKGKVGARLLKRRNTLSEGTNVAELLESAPKKFKSKLKKGYDNEKGFFSKTSPDRKDIVKQIVEPNGKIENGNFDGSTKTFAHHKKVANVPPSFATVLPIGLGKSAIIASQVPPNAAWITPYGSRLSVADITASQFRRGGIYEMSLPKYMSNERFSAVRRHSWQSDKQTFDHRYKSYPMCRYPEEISKQTEVPSNTAVSTEGRNEAEIDCLNALADLKSLKHQYSAVQPNLTRSQTIDSESSIDDNNDIPSPQIVEPIVRHPKFEWRQDHINPSIEDQSKIRYIPQKIRDAYNDRISINKLLA